MPSRANPWYIDQRAELLARLYLQDLGASIWATVHDGKSSPFDAIATFFLDGENPRIAAVSVKATEQPVGETFDFEAPLQLIRACSTPTYRFFSL